MPKLNISFSIGTDPKPARPHEVMSMLSSIVGIITAFAGMKKGSSPQIPPWLQRTVEDSTIREPWPGGGPELDDEDDDRGGLPASCWSWSSFSDCWTRLSNGAIHPQDVVLASLRSRAGGWVWFSDFLLDDDEQMPMPLHEAAKAVDRELFGKGLIAKDQLHDWRMFASQEPTPDYRADEGEPAAEA